ncbi:SWF or SNF family helicase [Streptomyces sp. CRN 30]|uniref:SWF or SNF family helicase n=1 Tax=Streptomyces sp. CRN 30 TaxID=3075613 RepID=UPI002A80FD6F|nr:SWF or SNF family helicase [Streptomyces sp. CRN 30]
MSTDEHDGARTFAALPPAHGRGFARTWWGQAWLRALEDAALDGAQVKAGRRLARAGSVGAVSVRPGRITAVVQDRDRTAHRADVLLQELSTHQWDRFLDMAVERAGHVAALLDREMPPHLVEDAAAAGVELLPGLGDLDPECDCGTWDHCAHTAALCYQVARLLDQDPFVLLLMRGREERSLLDDLQVRGTASAGTASAGTTPAGSDRAPADGPEGGLEDGLQGGSGGGPEDGVDAAGAYVAGLVLPPLPEPSEPPARPGPPPSLDTDARPAAGVDAAALEFLAARAAEDAHRLLVDALGGAEHPHEAHEAHEAKGEELTVGQDAVRLAAGDPGEEVLTRLARGSGRGPEELALAVHAWRYGGAAALSVLEDEWAPEGTPLARARAALEAAWDEEERPRLRAAGNRWTVSGGSAQLRLGRDGRWWPYRKQAGQWVPAGLPAQDPATALAVAAGDDDPGRTGG